ncbi:antibiotic biosynthesis monooxygenase [Bradyrhizobium sp. CCBAU 53340]|uniref:antibiotic biosynthesis monooxygenase family protein n=1 Tax=Bradyrhizobium sp. CCBAU 53340 TaxID=1325112 RepID=UPI001FEEB705|nr:antibiotic biosynthesis monooxygenase family protein [Bradyrhizobium sp. CCBAU 53340]
MVTVLLELPLVIGKASGNKREDRTGMISLINVFTVNPANQDRLLDLLARATDELVSRAPGFVSSTLHRSLDGTKVTMYAQWRSAEDYEAMRQDPGPLPFLEEALTIAKFEPGMYEVVRTFSPIDR